MFCSFLFTCFVLVESAKMLSSLFTLVLFLLVSSCNGREVHAECGSVKVCWVMNIISMLNIEKFMCGREYLTTCTNILY